MLYMKENPPPLPPENKDQLVTLQHEATWKMEQNCASPWCSEPRDINLRFNFYPIIDLQFANSNSSCLQKYFLWKNLFRNLDIEKTFYTINHLKTVLKYKHSCRSEFLYKDNATTF